MSSNISKLQLCKKVTHSHNTPAAATMAYSQQLNQSPYQTTVMQPVVVQPVQPVVVPVVSGQNTNSFKGCPFLRNGAKLGSCHFPGRVILIMCVFGGFFTLQYLIVLITTSSFIPGLSIFGLLGVPMFFIGCYLCTVAKKNYDTERSQESTAPSSEPFIMQGQPTGVAPPMYVPVPSGVPPPAQYPQQASSFSQPGMAMAPDGMKYPEPPPYSAPEKSFAPEYGQQDSYAPPAYAPPAYTP